MIVESFTRSQRPRNKDLGRGRWVDRVGLEESQLIWDAALRGRKCGTKEKME